MSARILIVDDDLNLLEGIERQLKRQFHFRQVTNVEIDTAPDGKTALAKMDQSGPYAVIVSDMQMPEMNGLELLSKVRERDPDTVRVMLTGNSDMTTAIKAVNEESVFQFLTKPCSSDTLTATLLGALARYRLVMRERELIEKTLKGTIKVIIDILAMANPIGFSRSINIQQCVRHVATKLKFPNAWEFELAGLLSQIGCFNLPEQLLRKVNEGVKLTEAEYKLYSTHPIRGCELLLGIPRLETIAHMIERQLEPYHENEHGPERKLRNRATLGAQILHAASAYDLLTGLGLSPTLAATELLKDPDEYDPFIVSTLRSMPQEKAEYQEPRTQLKESVDIADLTS